MKNHTSISGKTVCFTGHRRLPADPAPLREKLRQVLRQKAEEGVTCFRAGGALGFDTLAAQCVLELKEELPHLRLVLMLPCRDQARFWSAGAVREYERIRAAADEVEVLAETYTPGCMHRRDRALVEGSDLCICYLTHASGGTAYTVNEAKKRGVAVLNLAEEPTYETVPLFSEEENE